jgi:hypothetical protein
MNFIGHAYAKTVFVIYLQFKHNWPSMALFAHFGNAT